MRKNYKVHYTVDSLGYYNYGKIELMDDSCFYVDVGLSYTEDNAKFFSICHYLENPVIPYDVKQEFLAKNEGLRPKRDVRYYNRWLSSVITHSDSTEVEPLDPIEFEPLATIDDEFIDPFYNELDSVEIDILNKLFVNEPKYGNNNNAKRKFEVRYGFKRKDGNGTKIVSLGTVEDRKTARLYALCDLLSNPERAPKKSDTKNRHQISKATWDEYYKWLKSRHPKNKAPRLIIQDSTSPISSSSESATDSVDSSPKIPLHFMSYDKRETGEMEHHRYKKDELDLVDVDREVLEVPFEFPYLENNESINLFKNEMNLLDPNLVDKKALEVLFKIVSRVSANKILSEPATINKRDVCKNLLITINKHVITAEIMEEYLEWKEKNAHPTSALLRKISYLKDSERFDPYRRMLQVIYRNGVTPQYIKDYCKKVQKIHNRKSQKHLSGDRPDAPKNVKRPRLS